MECPHGYPEGPHTCPFCRRSGLALKEQGQKRALAAVDPEWEQAALRRIRYLAKIGEPFTVEDVVGAVGLPAEIASNRNNAVGALFSRLARKGVIRRIGYTQAARAESHGRVIAEWVGV